MKLALHLQLPHWDCRVVAKQHRVLEPRRHPICSVTRLWTAQVFDLPTSSAKGSVWLRMLEVLREGVDVDSRNGIPMNLYAGAFVFSVGD